MHDQNSDDSICIGPAAVQDQNSDDSICIGPANSDDSLCIGQEIAGVQDLLDSDLREERIFRAVEEGQTELLEGYALGTGTSPKQGSRAPIVRQTCRGSFSAGARFSVNFAHVFCLRIQRLHHLFVGIFWVIFQAFPFGIPTSASLRAQNLQNVAL